MDHVGKSAGKENTSRLQERASFIGMRPFGEHARVKNSGVHNVLRPEGAVSTRGSRFRLLHAKGKCSISFNPCALTA